VILHPAVLALLASSLIISGLLLYSARDAVRVLRHWDLASGSARQLELERRTYLVSTILGYVMVFELLSLFLYVYTADGLAPLFTGAMCAAGSLRAGPGGYPVLLLKLLNFVLAGLWLVVNHADALGYDYPLVRRKYAFLLGLAPLVLLESALQWRYFLSLRPEVITSCCGSLFGARGGGLGSDLAGLPGRPTGAVLAATLLAAAGLGLRFLRTGRGAVAFGALSALALPVSLAALVSFVSPYVYELPTHHCPFCILQREYHHVGYLLYATLLGGSVLGAGAGVVAPARRFPSLAAAVPALQRRLAAAAVALLLLFAALVAWSVFTSQLRA
jgi:hypothetical protein